MCECKTKSGVLCKKKPRPGSRFCYIHRNCDSSKKTSVKKVTKVTSSSDSTGFQVIQKRVTRKKTGKPVLIVAPEIDYGEKKTTSAGKTTSAAKRIAKEDIKLCDEVRGFVWGNTAYSNVYVAYQENRSYRYMIADKSTLLWANLITAHAELRQNDIDVYSGICNGTYIEDVNGRFRGKDNVLIFRELQAPSDFVSLRDIIANKTTSKQEFHNIMRFVGNKLKIYDRLKIDYKLLTANTVYINNTYDVVFTHNEMSSDALFRTNDNWQRLLRDVLSATRGQPDLKADVETYSKDLETFLS